VEAIKFIESIDWKIGSARRSLTIADDAKRSKVLKLDISLNLTVAN
jgi:hypothetical protein